MGSVSLMGYWPILSKSLKSPCYRDCMRARATSPPWRAMRGANRAEKERKRKGIGRLPASPAYAGDVGSIGDDSGVLFRASRAVIWKDRHDPLGNMAFACLCGAPSLIVISKCSKCSELGHKGREKRKKEPAHGDRRQDVSLMTLRIEGAFHGGKPDRD